MGPQRLWLDRWIRRIHQGWKKSREPDLNQRPIDIGDSHYSLPLYQLSYPETQAAMDLIVYSIFNIIFPLPTMNTTADGCQFIYYKSLVFLGYNVHDPLSSFPDSIIPADKRCFIGLPANKSTQDCLCSGETCFTPTVILEGKSSSFTHLFLSLAFLIAAYSDWDPSAFSSRLEAAALKDTWPSIDRSHLSGRQFFHMVSKCCEEMKKSDPFAASLSGFVPRKSLWTEFRHERYPQHTRVPLCYSCLWMFRMCLFLAMFSTCVLMRRLRVNGDDHSSDIVDTSLSSLHRKNDINVMIMTNQGSLPFIDDFGWSEEQGPWTWLGFEPSYPVSHRRVIFSRRGRHKIGPTNSKSLHVCPVCFCV